MATRSRRGSRVTAFFVVAGLVLAIALVALVVNKLLSDSGKPRKPTVHQIAILKPPPPPPPPKQEPKPPEIKKEEVKVEPPPQPQAPETQRAQEAPAAGDRLGVDADGSAGSDGFGLAARKGGRDITTIGQGSGTERAQFGWYTGRVQRHLQEELAKREELRRSDYRVVVRLWLARDGRVERAEVATSSGNAETDQAVRDALRRLPAIAEGPPENLPQPIRLRISSRGAG